MRHFFHFALSFCCLIACTSTREEELAHEPVLRNGSWRLSFSLKSGELPVNLILQRNQSEYAAFILNGSDTTETILLRSPADSLIFEIPPFGSILAAHIDSPELLSGHWINPNKPNQSIPFVAEYGKEFRFTPESSDFAINSTYQVTFEPKTAAEYPAVLNLKNDQGRLTGTFLTETGDYRFLEGNLYDGSLHLSTFDGSHAFLFNADIAGDSLINGEFFSGLSDPYHWVGIAGDNSSIQAPEDITKLISSNTTFDFRLPNENGDTMSWKDLELEGKVVIVDFTGSWCPNCMDAAKALTKLQAKFHSNQLIVLPISFELTNDPTVGRIRARRMFPKEYNAQFLYGGYASKQRIAELFPELSDFTAFPTLLFIDKNRRVRRIFTGFYGPGTGPYYDDFLSRSEQLIAEMLNE